MGEGSHSTRRLFWGISHVAPSNSIAFTTAVRGSISTRTPYSADDSLALKISLSNAGHEGFRKAISFDAVGESP
jgi:hypothetical protein